MAAPTVPDYDLMLVVTGSPYASDLVTTVLRLLDSLLRKGKSVQVWTCGYATTLTSAGLAEYKPVDLLDRHRRHPSPATLIGELRERHPKRLNWLVCQFCAEDRGATEHIGNLRTHSFSQFTRNARRSAKTVYIGGA